MLVGAQNYDVSGYPNSGIAYLYDISTASPGTPVRTIASPTPNIGSLRFGSALVMQGTRAMINAPGRQTSGKVPGGLYLYELSTPAVPPRLLTAYSPASRDQFGTALAISGTRYYAGAPLDGAGQVYAFDLSSATPDVPTHTISNANHTDTSNTYLGADGNILAVGAPRAINSAGRVSVYNLAGSNPTVAIHTIDNPSPVTSDEFGTRVALHGKWLAGSAERKSVGGVIFAGVVYLYDLTSGNPTVPYLSLPNPTPESQDFFGSALAVSNRFLAVGTYRKKPTGTVHVYDLEGPTPSVPIVIAGPTIASFGMAVALSGSTLAVTASKKVYVYDLASATPQNPIVTLNVPDFNGSSTGARAVAVDGKRILVGATLSSMGSYRGLGFVYDLDSPRPTEPVATLRNPRLTADDNFGACVVISGTNVLIGAPFEDLTAFDKGMVYLFQPSDFSNWKVAMLGDAFAGDLDDHDGDRFSALEEYAFSMDPKSPETVIGASGSHAYPDGQRLRMFVPREGSRSDVNIEVQAASQLNGPWETIATSVGGQPFTGPGYYGGDGSGAGLHSVEIRDPELMSAFGQRFLRAKVYR